MASTSTGHAAAVDDIVARLERLPTSWWQVKARIIVGVATFFDAFDALAIATVLPVIVPLWKLAPQQIGFMISAGFVGQLIGALLFGWVAERYGRMTAMIWSIALFAVMSLVCAFAWDYNSLLVFRTIQGIGLGGEVPVAAVFISELARAKGRGRFVLLYELVFPIGLVSASLVGLWVVPHFGWQWMFVIGALPAFLALVLRWLLPESPRWLAVRGHTAEAQAAMALIERETEKATGKPLPPPQPVVSTLDKPASLADLFGPLYLRRTLVVWVIWFAAYFVNYGLSIWLPTVYRTVFQLPLDVSLRYGLITQVVGLLGTLICALSIDYVGRRLWFAVSFAAATLALAALGDMPDAHRAAGADLHDDRLFLRQHHQYRRLSLHARALSDPRARAWRGHRHRLAAVRLHHRTDRGRPDDRCAAHPGADPRPAQGLPRVRSRRGDRGRHHRAVRGRDQRPGAGGSVPVIGRRMPLAGFSGCRAPCGFR